MSQIPLSQIPISRAWPLVAQIPTMLPIYIMVGILLAILAVIVVVVVLAYGSIWFQAYMSRARVSILELIGMSFRQVNAQTIVRENHGRSGGHCGRGEHWYYDKAARSLLSGRRQRGEGDQCVLIAAHCADLDLTFDRAAAMDLAGRDVLEAVRTSVYPKVIDCPDPAKSRQAYLSAVAQWRRVEGPRRVTVRTNLKRLIGGATEETIIARVGEGIITSIGSSESHFDALEHPDKISKAVLERGLDAQTAFEIVSIDIAHLEPGKNIVARLQADQAEADTRVARAKAEERRAQAFAFEQEMRAKVAFNRAQVVLAEAQVPEAMASAFRRGNLQSVRLSDGKPPVAQP